MKISVINGPNLNLLGIRNPKVYGNQTQEALFSFIRDFAKELSGKTELDFYQSNCEGDIIDKIHEKALGKYDGIILNAGALTHYSYAIRDAVEAAWDMGCATWEVHLSDVENRESFRKVSVIREVCRGTVFGLGFESYTEALKQIHGFVNSNK